MILRDTSKWNNVSIHLKTQQIAYSNAKQTDAGIKVSPATPDEYSDEQKFPYHIFTLSGNKQLHIVLRGIPTNFSTEEIKEELTQKCFHPKNLFRMNMQPNRNPIHLVLVLIPKSEDHIFKPTNLLNLSIKVESLKNRSRINHCKKCQQHGHGQSTCKAVPKCLKCAESHHTASCTKPRDQPAKCSHCADHSANYSKCPQNSNMIQP